jgi:serine/threonine protein kinase
VVLGVLGTGGMGAVYKARHRLMDRLVALKVIRKRFMANPTAVERFRREVQAAGRLTHPNIVTAYDAEQAGDTHFLVMELVEGVSLDRLIAKHGPLLVERATDCIRQAALGLQRAHERGMVHRDIKPQNLMLTPEGQIKILDFGLARFVSETAVAEQSGDSSLTGDTAASPVRSLTQIDSVMGTPDFMAPEQASNAIVADIRADIYSLGCTLYYLLTGKAPFYADTLVAKLTSHQERTPPPVSAVRSDVPATLLQVVERMMAKRPEERYQMPAEIAAALQPFAEGKAISTAKDAPTSKKPQLSIRSPLGRFGVNFSLNPTGCSLTLVLMTVALIAVGLGAVIYVMNPGSKDDFHASSSAPPPSVGRGGMGGMPPGGPPVRPDPREKPLPGGGGGELPADVLKKVEPSTLYIKVTGNDDSQWTGSGFLAFQPGIVLTNAHVVLMLEPGTEKPKKVTVIVHSGTPQEKQLDAEILGVDRYADLAILKVDPTGLPDPLKVESSTKLRRTQVVYVCGFPRGESLSKNVTIMPAQVTNVSLDPRGLAKEVQLQTNAQQGHSGGPVIDREGRVVGVLVRGIERTQINFAVPGDYVHVIFNGRLASMALGQSAQSARDVIVPVRMELINPLDHIREVAMDVWMGDPKAKAPEVSDKQPAARPGDTPRRNFRLSVQHHAVTGEIILPQWPLPEGKVYWVQPIVTYDRGDTWWLSATTYKGDMPVIPWPNVKIVHQHHTGSRTVKLTIKDDFKILGQKGEHIVLSSTMIAHLKEEASAPDKDGNVHLTYTFTGDGLDIKDNLKKEGNAAPKDKDQEDKDIDKDQEDKDEDHRDEIQRIEERRQRERERIMNNCSFLELHLDMNKKGGIIGKAGYRFDSKSPADVEPDLRQLGMQIASALQATAVALENREVNPKEHWEEKNVPMLIRVVGKGALSKMDLKYTYLGVRFRDNRLEGLIETTGVAKGEARGLRLGGRALVDIGNGFVFRSRATVKIDADLNLVQGTLRTRGTTEIDLLRSRED